MNTRRYPRTLQEAFGPYTSRDIQPMSHEPRPCPWLWIFAAVVVTGLTAVVTIS